MVAQKRSFKIFLSIVSYLFSGVHRFYLGLLNSITYNLDAGIPVIFKQVVL